MTTALHLYNDNRTLFAPIRSHEFQSMFKGEIEFAPHIFIPVNSF